MIEGANEISNLYHTMRSRGLDATAYPIPGLGLLTAASIHVIYTIFSWESMDHIINPQESRNYLEQDMYALNDLGQRWSLAIHWVGFVPGQYYPHGYVADPFVIYRQVRQISAFYKLNRLTKRSWESQSQENVSSSMNVKEIKDGIMNFVRQIGSNDRRARDVNLKPTFDFEGWLDALEESAATGARRESMLGLSHHVQSSTGLSISPTSYDLEALGFVNSPSGFLCLDGFTGLSTITGADISGQVEP